MVHTTFYWFSFPRKNSIFLLICSFLLFLITLPLSGQQMPRTVVGSAGDYYENLLFGNIHWTVGEIAVSDFQNGLQLGEGFHQVYYDLVVKTRDEPLPDWEVNIYPNPTAQLLNINLSKNEEVAARLFSSTGQLLLFKERIQIDHQINLEQLPAGTYWLQLLDKEGRQRHFQVQKIGR